MLIEMQKKSYQEDVFKSHLQNFDHFGQGSMWQNLPRGVWLGTQLTIALTTN